MGKDFDNNLSDIKKNIYLVLGFIFFGIGLFGYYMPLIPGTIFMIISAYCFMNSSEKLYNKIKPYKNLKRYIYMLSLIHI